MVTDILTSQLLYPREIDLDTLRTREGGGRWSGSGGSEENSPALTGFRTTHLIVHSLNTSAFLWG